MNRFLEHNQKVIRNNYPYDIWADIDIAPQIQVSSWCAECLKKNRYNHGVVIFRGDSLCEEDFRLRVSETE